MAEYGPASRRVTALVVTLSCGCEIGFKVAPPRYGQSIWCGRHQGMRCVVSVTGTWRWKCQQCRGSRRYGVVRWNAFRSARSHCESSGHAVTVWQENVSDSETEILSDGETESIPF